MGAIQRGLLTLEDQGGDQFFGEPMLNVEDLIQTVGVKGTQQGVVNILASDEMRQGIKDYSNWPTVPQLYVKGEFVGGCDIVREMFETGELKAMLDEQGVALAG